MYMFIKNSYEHDLDLVKYHKLNFDFKYSIDHRHLKNIKVAYNTDYVYYNR